MYNLVNDANRLNRISFYVFNPEGRLGVGSYFEDPNDPVVAGQWMDFTGVSANGAITIYKNGIDTEHCFQDQGRIVVDPVAGSSPLRIGTLDGECYFLVGSAVL